METYEKENGQLKITTPKSERLSFEQLKDKKAFADNQLAEFIEYSARTVLEMKLSIDRANNALMEAGKLGVVEAVQTTIIN